MKASSQTGSKRPLWQFLLPPMLLASLALHGAVLFTPVAPSEDDLVPPPDPEEDGIGITRIDPPQPRPTTQILESVGALRPAPVTPTPSANQPSASNNNRRSDNRGASRGRPDQTTDNRRSRQSNQPSNRSSGTQSGDIATLPSSEEPVEVAGLPSPLQNSPENEKFDGYLKTLQSYQETLLMTDEFLAEEEELWLTIIAEDIPGAAELKAEPIDGLGNVPYEPGFCLPKAPEQAQILVFVNADGSVNEYTQLIQTTGYSELDTAAEDLLRNTVYPQNGANQAYLAKIEVDYDAQNCRQPEEVVGLPDEYFTLLNSYDPALQTNDREAEAIATVWLNGVIEAGEVDAPGTDDTPETDESADTDSEAVEGLPFPTLAAFDSEIEYPYEACLLFEPKDAWWGVTINPDGSLSGDPTPLKSTGYSKLDQQSEELVKNFSYPSTENSQAYVVEVPVAYSVLCKEPTPEEFPLTAASRSNAPAIAAVRDENDATGTPQNSAVTARPAPTDTSTSTQLAQAGLQNVNDDPAGKLNVDNPGLVASIVNNDWPEALSKSCFLAENAASDRLTPAADGETAFLFQQNADLAIESIARLYALEPTESGEYCGAPLTALQTDGTSQLFASIVGIGPGNASALVVIWPSDPRKASDTVPSSSSSSQETPNRTPEPQLEEQGNSPENTVGAPEATPPPAVEEPNPTQNPRGLGMLLLEVLEPAMTALETAEDL